MRRVIIAGGRDFDDYSRLETVCDLLLLRDWNYPVDDLVILCGRARGADTLGARFATENAIVVEDYPADWEKHGKNAGWMRNRQMVQADAHMLIAFWDGQSKGTKNVIETALEHGLEVHVYRYRNDERF